MPRKSGSKRSQQSRTKRSTSRRKTMQGRGRENSQSQREMPKNEESES
ncbi:MAG TPA: hypothetical protein VN661_12970 [Candidatus Acidoferrales bacterium]|nr:hypothetical protein [Candidatus Acidoferrales bacterium]